MLDHPPDEFAGGAEGGEFLLLTFDLVVHHPRAGVGAFEDALVDLGPRDQVGHIGLDRCLRRRLLAGRVPVAVGDLGNCPVGHADHPGEGFEGLFHHGPAVALPLHLVVVGVEEGDFRPLAPTAELAGDLIDLQHGDHIVIGFDSAVDCVPLEERHHAGHRLGRLSDGQSHAEAAGFVSSDFDDTGNEHGALLYMRSRRL